MINTYISDLLYRYECVIVPGFGAFLAQQKSATIDAVSNAFLPPRKEITFNEQLQQNDGLLANHIAQSQSCEYSEALVQLTKFVHETKSTLIAGEAVVLSKIGYFTLNTEGKLQFNTTNEVNYLTQSFGLSSTVNTPILREVYKEEVVALEEKAPIVFTPETRRKRKKQPYLQYAAIAVVALGMSGFFGNNYIASKQQEVITHNEKTNIEATKMAYQKAAFFDVDPILVPAAKLPITVEKEVFGKYHIIAGAFRFEENADKKITQLLDNGFKAKKIGVNKYGLHQVVYASFENRRAALNELQAIKRNENKAAWLLVKELDQ